MRKANEIATNLSGGRPAFMVELGAALLCLAEEDASPALAAEGLDVLERATVLAPRTPLGGVDVQHARILIADPKKACAYSRDDWINEPPPDDPER
jgi:hypothetical protein